MNPFIQIKQISYKGRGIVAKMAIEPNACLEEAPTVELLPGELLLIDKTTIGNYYFMPRREFANPNSHLVLGLISCCNHSNKPNAKVEWVKRDDIIFARLMTIIFVEQGEEVTIDYGDVWFTVV